MPRLSNSAITLPNHSFPGLQWSPHMHVLVSTLLNSQEGPPTDFFFLMQLLFFNTLSCKFLPSVLPNFSSRFLSHSLFGHTLLHMGSQFPSWEWNWAPALEAQSLNCCTTTEVPQHCLCSLGSQLSSSWAPPSCATAQKLSQGSEQGSSRAHLFVSLSQSSPSFTSSCPYLESFVSCILSTLLLLLFYVQAMLFYVVACGILVLPSGDEPRPLALGAWSLNHQTARVAPVAVLDRRVNLVLVTPCWLEAEVDFLFIITIKYSLSLLSCVKNATFLVSNLVNH